MGPLGSSLYFNTPAEWVESVTKWAASIPEIENVWVFGSRATGVRSYKEKPPPLPDFDLAYTLTGDEPGALLALSICEGGKWREHLQAEIPVPVDLQMANPESDERVWPAVLDHGVAIYSRTT